MLVEADWILPISGPPVAHGAVVIDQGTIAAVGRTKDLREQYPLEEVRTFAGCVLLPGLVNTHTHLEYSALEGFIRSCSFGEWMLHLLLARRKLDPEDYAISALWGARECVRGGVTAIADTSFEGSTTARAAGSARLRARVYLEVFGLDDAELPATMSLLEERLARLTRECGPLVEAGISPHAPYTVSARLYEEVDRYARRRELRLATHLAESAAENELLVFGSGAIPHAYQAAGLWRGERWEPPGVGPVALLGRRGVLGPRLLAVHCVQIDETDIAALARSGAPVAHCPRSNLRLQCGSAPIADLQRAGVTVGLGTDSLASNDNLDMFAEMRAALAVSRARASGARPGITPAPPLTAGAVLQMATLDGARALGWDHLVGSLEVGKRADIIAVRLVDPESAGSVGDPVEAVVSGATADDVVITMVDGVVVNERPRTEEELRRLVAEEAAFERAFSAVRFKLGLGDAFSG